MHKRRNSDVSVAPVKTSESADESGKKMEKKRRKDPALFIVWCMIKSSIQMVLSIRALEYLMLSGFFIPGGYNAAIWPKDTVTYYFVCQVVFEVIDFIAELAMLKYRGDLGQMPWDSIIHHGLTAGYFFLAWLYSDVYPMEYIGLAFAPISCQLVGPFYTAHRLGFRTKALIYGMITTQFAFRWPLALASWGRVFAHYNIVPLAHIGICIILTILDFRWSKWQFKVFKRRKLQDKQKKTNEKETLTKKQESSSWLNNYSKLETIQTLGE